MTRSKPVILNIDDDVAGRYAVGRVLRQSGYGVLEAGDGESGLRLATLHRPDFILLDVRLPDIDGFEVSAASARIPGRGYPGRPDVCLVCRYGVAGKGLENGRTGTLPNRWSLPSSSPPYSP